MIRSSLAVAIAALATAMPVAAQDYPTRPLRVITSQGAGGISDLFMRSLGEELHKALGQPVIVENRTGANGNIGARACADAAPDGYTFCILPSEPLTYNQLTMKNPGFDAEKSLAPITNLFFLTQVLTVTTALNVKTLDQLAALSKAKPGTLSYTTPGLATALFVETFKKNTGADLVRVPFKGGGDAINGMLTGATPVGFFGIGNFMPYLQAGTMAGLAVDTEKRAPLFPDIPTARELGYRGPITAGYFALLAPAGTPKPIIDKLRDTTARIASDPAFRAKNLIDRGHEPVMNTPEEFAAFLLRDREIAKQVVKEAGVEPQ